MRGRLREKEKGKKGERGVGERERKKTENYLRGKRKREQVLTSRLFPKALNSFKTFKRGLKVSFNVCV